MLLKKTIIEIIKEYKITPKKRFGQNFIFDNNVLNKIADTITPVRDNLIIEVGPGVGNLTRKLLERKPKNLILIERDSDFKNILDDLLLFFPKTNTKLIFNDFLKVEFDKVELYKNRKVKIISNLPYYISTQILIKVLPFNANLLEVIFMFQKEVADRLLAIPGSKNYSKLTVIVQYCCNINKICDIKSNVFYPKPEVNSSLLRFTKKKSVNNQVFSIIKKLVKLAFQKRRKTIKNSLSSIKGIVKILKKLNIDDKSRAENLSVKQYTDLAIIIINENLI